MTRDPRHQAGRASDGGGSPKGLRRARRLGAALASGSAAGVIAAGTMLIATPAASAAGGEPPFETITTPTPAVLQITPVPSLPLFNLSASLVWVQIIAGEPITFTAGGVTLCTATTNYLGVASCNIATNLVDVLAVAVAGGYTATFAGDNSFAPGFAPSSGKAGLIG